jgi:hypothetical protein
MFKIIYIRETGNKTFGVTHDQEVYDQLGDPALLKKDLFILEFLIFLSSQG